MEVLRRKTWKPQQCGSLAPRAVAQQHFSLASNPQAYGPKASVRSSCPSKHCVLTSLNRCLSRLVAYGYSWKISEQGDALLCGPAAQGYKI